MPGAVLAEKYRIDSLLGRGGMGSVWLAQHTTLDMRVAIKVIEPAERIDEMMRQRFLQEARAAALLSSPHVVQIFDYGIDRGTPFIVMERLLGETLGSRLARERVLAPEVVCVILSHVSRAVQKAHEAGIVHRDLKPDNVFLATTEDGFVAKVLDFGAAKALIHTERVRFETSKGALVGSPSYMSPEQAHGARHVDHRSDLWSLGVIAFECLTGQVPFQGPGWGELIAKICRDSPPVPSSVNAVPEGFDSFFAQACEHDPGRRFQSARAQMDALKVVLVPESGVARLVSTGPPKSQPAIGPAHPNATTFDLMAPTAAASGDVERIAAATADGVTLPESTSSTVPSPVEPPRRARAVRRGAMIGIGVVTLIALGVWQSIAEREASPPARATVSGASPARPLSSDSVPPRVTAAAPPPQPEPSPSAKASSSQTPLRSAAPLVSAGKRYSGGTKKGGAAAASPSSVRPIEKDPNDVLRERE